LFLHLANLQDFEALEDLIPRIS